MAHRISCRNVSKESSLFCNFAKKGGVWEICILFWQSCGHFLCLWILELLNCKNAAAADAAVDAAADAATNQRCFPGGPKVESALVM